MINTVSVFGQKISYQCVLLSTKQRVAAVSTILGLNSFLLPLPPRARGSQGTSLAADRYYSSTHR